jgi:predicted RNase H-like HicB family nuclease
MEDIKKIKVLKYTAIFEPDKEVGGYVVTIPALPGCVSQGDSFEEALGNIKEAAELYLEVLKEEKEEIPVEESPVVAPIEVRV